MKTKYLEHFISKPSVSIYQSSFEVCFQVFAMILIEDHLFNHPLLVCAFGPLIADLYLGVELNFPSPSSTTITSAGVIFICGVLTSPVSPSTSVLSTAGLFGGNNTYSTNKPIYILIYKTIASYLESYIPTISNPVQDRDLNRNEDSEQSPRLFGSYNSWPD